MAKIKFLTDSASDITEELEKKLDIQIMNFKVAMGDDSYTSRIDFDNEKFYKMLDDFGKALQEEKINKVCLIAFAQNNVGNAFWNTIGWTERLDLNYYDFTLNEENITAFNGQ